MACLDLVHSNEDSDENNSGWETDGSNEEEDLVGQALNAIAKNAIVIEPTLLPIPLDLALPGDKLCDICKALNLTARRFVVHPNDPDAAQNVPDSPGTSLGLVKDMLKKKSCPFCRLVIVALGGSKVPAEENGELTTVDISWNTDGPKRNPHTPWIHEPQIRILRPYCQLVSGGFVGGEKMLNLFPEITLLANDAPAHTKEKTFFVRPIREDRIDFSVVKNWFQLCEEWHGEACDEVEMLQTPMHPASETSGPFRVIDVIDHCIVLGETNCTYAALSYVWGQVKVLRLVNENTESLEQVGALKLPEFYDQIPWTVRDAIVATRDMGLRYLWVDSLCIVQDDATGQKADHISKMDLVYGSAFVTLIAATGSDANAGLPGVRPGTRHYRQPIEQLMPGLRVAFKPKMVDYLEDAVYNTRGWTFQEKLFSRRSLYFIGGGVVFSCRRASEWREDVVFENETGIIGDQTMPEQGNDIGKMEGLIQSYSGMKFTFDSDIYNAFTGISKYVSRELKSNLCHGIPEAFFDWSLLWENLNYQTRRPKAPSWSWSGWVGESWSRIWDWYTRDIEMIRKAQRDRTWIIWYHRKAHDSEECKLVCSHNRQTSQSHPRNFYGGDAKPRFDIDCSVTRPTPRTLTNAPEYFKDPLNPHPGSGFLQFWTVSVIFRLDTPITSVDNNGPTKKDARFGIFGRNGKQVGNIYVSKSYNPGHIQEEHEFILLCEGRDERAERGRGPDDEAGWKYKLMLLEWHGDWAERVSVGTIKKKALDQALGKGPVWKEVILG